MYQGRTHGRAKSGTLSWFAASKEKEGPVRVTTPHAACTQQPVAGPPALVGALQATLERVGVDSDDIRSEEFFGY